MASEIGGNIGGDLAPPEDVLTIVASTEWTQPGSNVKRNVRVLFEKKGDATRGSYRTEVEMDRPKEVDKDNGDGTTSKVKIAGTVWKPFSPPLQGELGSDILRATHQAGLVAGYGKATDDERNRVVDLLDEAFDLAQADDARQALAALKNRIKAGDKASPRIEQPAEWSAPKEPAEEAGKPE
jgi:hypothetical protein